MQPMVSEGIETIVSSLSYTKSTENYKPREETRQFKTCLMVWLTKTSSSAVEILQFYITCPGKHAPGDPAWAGALDKVTYSHLIHPWQLCTNNIQLTLWRKVI